MIGNKSNIYQEIYIIKHCVLKRLHDIDTSIASYVRIKSDPTVLFNNKLQSIVAKKSKLFYMMLISRQISTPHMETIYMLWSSNLLEVNIYGKSYITKKYAY